MDAGGEGTMTFAMADEKVVAEHIPVDALVAVYAGDAIGAKRGQREKTQRTKSGRHHRPSRSVQAMTGDPR